MKKEWKTIINDKFIKGLLLVQLAIILFLALGLFEKKDTISFGQTDFEVYEEAKKDDGYVAISTTPVALKRGVYKVDLNYETDVDMENVWSVKAEDVSYDGLYANTCMLYSGMTSADMYIWLTEKIDGISVEVKYNQDSRMSVYGAFIQETNMGTGILLVTLLAIFAVIDGYLWSKFRLHKILDGGTQKDYTHKEDRCILYILILTVLTASFPLFTGYEIAAADTGYHLLRIEGIKDGLLAGQFPVRLQPNWLQGYGYATGIFYCDTYLYIPALLRIAGFPVGIAYLLYKLMVNVITVVLAYFSFSKMFANKWAAVWGTLLYALNIYRLLCMYLKDHLGQYTAMAFLPLLAYSVWRLLKEDVDACEYKQNWIILTIAATCIVQCHVLTCELALLFCVIIASFFVRNIFRKETLKQIMMSVVMILGINAWFLIPFADYMMTQQLNITGESVYTRAIQGYGSLLPQMFGVFALAGGADRAVSEGIQGEIPFTIGIALLITLLYFLYLWYCRKAENKQMKVCAVLSVIALFMSTVYFPWDRIQALGGAIAKLVSALQYPTRMLEMVALFLALLACGCIVNGSRLEKRESFYLYLGITIAMTILTTGMFFSTLLSQSPFYKIYEADAMGNAYLSGKEYLPEGTDENLLKAGRYIMSENIEIDRVQKNGTKIQFECSNTEDIQGYVEVPLLYYKGYQAKSLEDGQTFAVTDGDNHVVRIKVPEKYSGNIMVDFVSPWDWRLAEVISLVFIIGFLIIWRKERMLIKN